MFQAMRLKGKEDMANKRLQNWQKHQNAQQTSETISDSAECNV